MQLPGARGKKETGCKRAGDRDVLYHHCNCAHMTVSTCQNPSNHTLTLLSTNVIICKFSSVPFSRSVMSDSLWPHEPQHTRPPCPSPTPRVYANPCPTSRWCHPTISSSAVPLSSCPQSFQASGSFPMSQLFASGGQNIGVSASTSVFPMKTQTDLL